MRLNEPEKHKPERQSLAAWAGWVGGWVGGNTKVGETVDCSKTQNCKILNRKQNLQCLHCGQSTFCSSGFSVEGGTLISASPVPP